MTARARLVGVNAPDKTGHLIWYTKTLGKIRKKTVQLSFPSLPQRLRNRFMQDSAVTSNAGSLQRR
jgi:hypothetical protein